MKNTWLQALFVVGIIAIVLIALNYREKNKDLPLTEIFPEENAYPVNVEYVDEAAPSQTVKKEVPSQPVKQKSAAAKPAPVSQPAVSVASGDTVANPAVTETKAAATVSTVSSTTKYTIQIASSKEQDRAQEFITKLKSKNYDAFMVPVEIVGKGTWYRVYTGQFDTKAAADQALVNVQKDFPTAFISNYKK
jgi:cell division septation protein DedD